MTHAHDVTNTAVVQYLELVYGFDVQFFRRSIARLAETGIREGATGVIVEGVKLVLKDGRVVAVIEKHRPSCDRRSRPTAAILAEMQPISDAELVMADFPNVLIKTAGEP